MSALVDCAQPGGVDVRVPLGCRQRRMPQHFLNGTQISPSLEEVSRRGMPQPMRSNVVHARSSGHFVDHCAYDTRIDAPPLGLLRTTRYHWYPP